MTLMLSRLWLALRRDPSFLLNLSRSYGNAVRFKAARYSVVLLNHPNAVKDVLVTQHRNFVKGRAHAQARTWLGNGLLVSEGDLHSIQRRIMQPAFHARYASSYADIAVKHTARLCQRWEIVTRSNQILDIAHEMLRLTLAIAAEALFGIVDDADIDTLGWALDELAAWFSARTSPWLVERVSRRARQRQVQIRDQLDRILYRIIDTRLNSEGMRDDLLAILLHSMDRADVRDQLLTLLFAGRETVANALSWTWFLLSQHRDIETQLHADLDCVLDERLPNIDDIPHLHYTRMVLAESLRLYPTAWLTTRRAIEACLINGEYVPAGSVVLMCQYAMHRNPRYYLDPDRFDPTRWALETQPEHPRFAYFPFGAGPRQCIGESFAWLSATLIIANLAQRWRLRLLPGHVVEPLPSTSLHLKHGLPMVVALR